MKRVLALSFVVCVWAAPLYAGHGTIEETDTAIIVEYTGDAGDAKRPAPSTGSWPALPPKKPVGLPSQEAPAESAESAVQSQDSPSPSPEDASQDGGAKAMKRSQELQERIKMRKAARRAGRSGGED